MDGHANFLRMKNTTRNARSVQIINPKPGVSSCIKIVPPSPKRCFNSTHIEEANFINSILLNNVQNVEGSDTTEARMCTSAGNTTFNLNFKELAVRISYKVELPPDSYGRECSKFLLLT